MHTHNTGGNSRSKTKTFIHRHAGMPAPMPETWSGQMAPGFLTREDLRHLVAAMVD